jgi:molybdopterin synthase sulfur carrier subunit
VSGATINLLYFARIAELTGTRGEAWPHDADLTGDTLLAALLARYPALTQATRLKLAVNQVHTKTSVSIQPGDEVALFEPVTGG